MNLLTVEFPHPPPLSSLNVLVSTSFSNTVNLFTAYHFLGQCFTTGGTGPTGGTSRSTDCDKRSRKQELKLIINIGTVKTRSSREEKLHCHWDGGAPCRQNDRWIQADLELDSQCASLGNQVSVRIKKSVGKMIDSLFWKFLERRRVNRNCELNHNEHFLNSVCP
jgi:hypothetical protein